jgi:hypothetical protein
VVEFPEVSNMDVHPDRDFKMVYHLLEDNGTRRTLAEYVDGKIVFK